MFEFIVVFAEHLKVAIAGFIVSLVGSFSVINSL